MQVISVSIFSTDMRNELCCSRGDNGGTGETLCSYECGSKKKLREESKLYEIGYPGKG